MKKKLQGKEATPVLTTGLPTNALLAVGRRPPPSIFLDTVAELQNAAGAGKREERGAGGAGGAGGYVPVDKGLQIEQIQVGCCYEAERDGSGKYYTCVVHVIDPKEHKCYVEWQDGTESSFVAVKTLRLRQVDMCDSD